VLTSPFHRDRKATLNGTDKSYRLYVAKMVAFKLFLPWENRLTDALTGKQSKT